MRPRPTRRPPALRAALAGGAFLAAAAGPTPGCREAPAAPPRNLLLVTVDTLRADHVGAWGHRHPTTPHLDRLAAEGVRFADASVAWPKTWPSVASMLTGTHPATTGVHLRYRHLVAGNLTLAEVLRRRGFRTGAVVANPNLARRFGYAQGFETFVESWQEALRESDRSARIALRQPGRVKRYTDAERVTRQAAKWLEGLEPGERFFLWVHYMDPHGPYRPPGDLAERFADAYESQRVPASELPTYQWIFREEGGIERDLARYKARYDGEILRWDAQLGALRRALEEVGRDPGTLVAVTADHGESLSEHGYYLEHGLLPFQPTAHVPLVLHHRGTLPAGRVVEVPVGLVDLVPTLLELLGAPAPPSVQGRSLLPRIAGDETAPEPVFMESGYGTISQLVVRHGPWKLVHTRSEEDRRASGLPEWALFHLEEDPGERRNVIDEHGDVARRLRAALATWRDRTPRRPTPDEEPRVPAATRGLLRGLGYIETRGATDQRASRGPAGSSEPVKKSPTEPGAAPVGPMQGATTKP